MNAQDNDTITIDKRERMEDTFYEGRDQVGLHRCLRP